MVEKTLIKVAFVVLVVLTLSMLLAHILLRNCHQLLYHLPRSNSCIKGSWQGWSEEGDSKFLKCLTTSIANYSSRIDPPVPCNTTAPVSIS